MTIQNHRLQRLIACLMGLVLVVTGAPAFANTPASHHGAAGTSVLHPAKRGDFTKRERAQWHALLRWSDECESEFEETHSQDSSYGGLNFYGLTKTRYVVAIDCALSPFQPETLLLLYEADRRAARPLALPGFAFDGQGRLQSRVDAVQTGFVEFHAERQELSILSLARGDGDCGTYAIYDLKDGEPKIKCVRGRECGPLPASESETDPQKWPLLDLSKTK